MSIYDASAETGTPNPPASSRMLLYPKNGLWYSKNEHGVESCISPILGEMRRYAGEDVPAGWIECRGQLLAVSNYPKLFAEIGGQYGIYGITHFKVPNDRRVIMYTDTYPQVVTSIDVIGSICIDLPVNGYVAVGSVLHFSVVLIDPVTVVSEPPRLSITIGSQSHLLDRVTATTTIWTYDHVVQSVDFGSVTAAIDLHDAALSSDGTSVNLITYLQQPLLLPVQLTATASITTAICDSSALTMGVQMIAASSTMTPTVNSYSITI